MSHEERISKNYLQNPRGDPHHKVSDRQETMNNSNRQYNNSTSAKQSAYQNQDRDDYPSRRSKNSRRGEQPGEPMIVFPKPIFRYLSKVAYH